jgi:hypothetical protein
MTGPAGLTRKKLYKKNRVCGSALIGFECGSASRRAKMTHKIEKSKEFSCFEMLQVLFSGLKASPVAWIKCWIRIRIQSMRINNPVKNRR